MSARRNTVEIPVHVPDGCILVDEYTPGQHTIHIGDEVNCYPRVGPEFTAKVTKIVAVIDTSFDDGYCVREVEVIGGVKGRGVGADEKMFRTFTPDKITLASLSRHEQREEENMKVEAYKGELPKRPSGKVRTATPFDTITKTDGKHKVTLEKGDDSKKIVAQIRNAAKFNGKGVKIHAFDDEIIFQVQKRIVRSTGGDS
jgi:hypothetical protein